MNSSPTVQITKCKRNRTSKKPEKSKGFNVRVLLFLTNGIKKIFTVRNVHNSMTIKTLRSDIELITGIPYHLQRLHYIDEG